MSQKFLGFKHLQVKHELGSARKPSPDFPAQIVPTWLSECHLHLQGPGLTTALELTSEQCWCPWVALLRTQAGMDLKPRAALPPPNFMAIDTRLRYFMPSPSLFNQAPGLKQHGRGEELFDNFLMV